LCKIIRYGIRNGDNIMGEPTGNSETLPDEVGINVEDVVNNNAFRNMLDDNTMDDDLF
jgi:ASC-1-like (ASCH) protein